MRTLYWGKCVPSNVYMQDSIWITTSRSGSGGLRVIGRVIGRLNEQAWFRRYAK